MSDQPAFQPGVMFGLDDSADRRTVERILNLDGTPPPPPPPLPKPAGPPPLAPEAGAAPAAPAGAAPAAPAGGPRPGTPTHRTEDAHEEDHGAGGGGDAAARLEDDLLALAADLLHRLDAAMLCLGELPPSPEVDARLARAMRSRVVFMRATARLRGAGL